MLSMISGFYWGAAALVCLNTERCNYYLWTRAFSNSSNLERGIKPAQVNSGFYGREGALYRVYPGPLKQYVVIGVVV